MSSVATRKVIRKRRSWKESFHWITSSVGHLKTAAEARFIVITGSAAVERTLEDAIIFKLGGISKKTAEELFNENAPLGSFSAKIKIGHALGLYGSHTKSDLNKVREIRNILAHAVRPVTFANRRLRDLCFALNIPKRFPPDDPEYRRQPYGNFILTIDMLDIEIGQLSNPRFTRKIRRKKAKLP